MSDLFPACAKVLWQEMRPLHYEQLTLAALGTLGHKDVDKPSLGKLKEDVREKMLEAGQYETFYVGKPHYVAIMRDWFLHRQRMLFNTQAWILTIPGSVACGIDACVEAVMRSPFMMTKVANTPARWQGLARGLVIEKHISSWFRSKWPDFWKPPANEGQWSQWCDHDFKLVVEGQEFDVDAMGPRKDGTFGKPAGGGKRDTFWHIVGAPDGNNVVVHGFIRGYELRETFLPEETRPISHLVVWLNCVKYGLPWHEIKARLKRANEIANAG